MTDHTTTDQPAHYADRKVEVIDTIREALGEGGFQAFCRGNVIKYTLRAGRKGDFCEDMRKAANYARWASGEEWRPGRDDSATPYTDALARWNAKDVTPGPPREPRKVCTQLADPAEPSACIECGNGDCTDIASGYCCECYADEYGGDTWCSHCVGLLPEAPEAPPQVADILGRPVKVTARTGCGGPWGALVDIKGDGGGHRYFVPGHDAEGMRTELIHLIRASGVAVPGE